ncbi:MAG: DUF4340 domain-containing protein [Phycisphaerales bacterium]
MNYKTTLILVLLLALVGGYFYFVESGKISGYEAHEQATQQTNQPEGEPVFADLIGKTDAIKRFDVVRGDQSFTVIKEADRWLQTEPVRFPLNDYTPQAVARQFAELRYLERVTPGKTDAPTPEQMGLDNPRAVVTAWHDDQQTSLKLGKLTLGGNGYVQVEGETDAYIVDAALFGSVLDADITDWRSTTLEIPEASKASGVAIFSADGSDIFLVKQDGRWRFDTKSVQRAGQGAIESWFSSAGGVWISGFIKDKPDNLALYGLDADYLRIQFTEEDAEGNEVKHTLHIGDTDLKGANRYAAWTDGADPITVVFTINSASAEALARTINDLTDPKVIAADAADVRGLIVKQGDQTTLRLLRDPQEGYSFGGDDPGYKADYSASHAMVTQLCGLTSERHMPVNEINGDPIADIHLTLASNDAGLNFAVYNQGDDLAIVSEGESIAYLVPAGELDTLLDTSLGLRDRTVLDIVPDSIAKMTLVRDDGVTFTFEPKPAAGESKAVTWRLTGHENYETDAIAALVKTVGPLRAERWLPEPVSPSAGWIEWTIEPVGGAPITLKADPQTGNAVMGVNSAFVLPQVLLQKLNAEYRDRTVLAVEIDRIQSVKLASNETNLTVTRNGQQYVSDLGEVTQPMAAAVFDTLAGLRVRRYIPPMQTPPGEVTFTIEMTTDDNTTRMLRVFDAGNDTLTVSIEPPPGADHTAWFTLDRADVDKLRAPLGDVTNPVK